jgi:hypothetical protein
MSYNSSVGSCFRIDSINDVSQLIQNDPDCYLAMVYDSIKKQTKYMNKVNEIIQPLVGKIFIGSEFNKLKTSLSKKLGPGHIFVFNTTMGTYKLTTENGELTSYIIKIDGISTEIKDPSLFPPLEK